MAEAPGLVAGFHDVAVMGEPVQQSGGHLGIDEHAAPLAETQVGRDHHAGALIEFREQMEQQRAAGLAERQIAAVSTSLVLLVALVSGRAWLVGG